MSLNNHKFIVGKRYRFAIGHIRTILVNS